MDKPLRLNRQPAFMDIITRADAAGLRSAPISRYCNIINNESFAWFESTDSKSRENFVSLLHRPWTSINDC
ncbi:hypothetical protein [Endozoicomonas sp. SCSIO W0465]|uniref:hypothetical protein n=1 Tax=Endozoicomonas sp. SCSIO W0465 TaxID=2918516 RepID=UPI002075CF01|nr:hypothetical protein [Endozoicomonas sp. SCSIO W0465]USE33999.1 hypothetical protein MJO57_17700 [Endozoicomonas sp. SCSIO W0465]